MDHSGTTVYDDPFAVVLALDAGFGKTGIPDFVTDTGGQCLGLAIGCATGNHDAFEQRGHLFGIEDHDVLGFHIFEPIDDGPLKFLNVAFGTGLGHEWHYE